MTDDEVISKNMPCGCCDMGVYSELSMLNRKAREFSLLSEKERLEIYLIVKNLIENV